MDVAHLIRETVLAGLVIVALMVAAAIVVNGALAVVIGIVALWVVAVIMPLEVIRYDERRPRAHRPR